MKKIIIIILVVFAVYQLKPDLFSPVGGLVGGGANGNVIIFTHSDCGSYCEDAVAMLRHKNIPFEEHNVQTNKDDEALWRKMGGGNPFPVIHVGDTKLHGFYRRTLMYALAEEYGLDALDASHKSVVQQQIDQYGDDVAIMYATEWCPYCKKAREFFNNNGISFVEIDVEKSSDGKRAYNSLDASGYPVIFVGIHRFDGFGGNIPSEIKNVL